ATTAALPPDEPPGVRLRSQGLRDGPKAEFSVELPMANSSMLARPKGIAPAARRRVMTVASYFDRYGSRIFEPHVHGSPTTLMTSLMAIGTPPRGLDKSAA